MVSGFGAWNVSTSCMRKSASAVNESSGSEGNTSKDTPSVNMANIVAMLLS
jgi:hypothetical protein